VFIIDFVNLGALDDAYELANGSLDEYARAGTIGAVPWSWLWAPEARPFRTDARFQAFVTRLKLMDYWKQYGPPDECDIRGEQLTCH
jgi:hypothetical protein